MFQAPRGVYRWSIFGSLTSVSMAAICFHRGVYAPGVWLLILTAMMGLQAMVAAHDASLLDRRPDPPDSTAPRP